MVRVIRAWIIVLLAMIPLVGTSERAVANTELVPGSRLIFPYIDISAGRETFLMLTNSGEQFLAPVHLEFYAQSCLRYDTAVHLTPGDTAAVQVSKALPLAAFPAVPGNSAQQNIAGIGWADVDVRYFLGGSDSLGATGVEYNGLMGEAVIVDTVGDFLFAYSAAASQGFAAGGFTSTTATINGSTYKVPTGPIVSRDAFGFATSWTGAYETYPSTNLIPSFLAEDACSAHGPLRAAFISEVAPADAWRKEAPGQALGVGTPLLKLNVLAFDGAEHAISNIAYAHHVSGRLCTVFPDIATRTQYNNPPMGAYPDVDQTLGATTAVGWLKLWNRTEVPWDSSTGPAPNPHFSAANGFDTSIRPRGMVGVLFELDTKEKTLFKGKGQPPVIVRVPVRGDAVRTWADPASAIDWPCFGSESAGGEFSKPGGVTPPTLLPGVNTPTCDKAPSVPPTWLREHGQTSFGAGGGG